MFASVALDDLRTGVDRLRSEVTIDDPQRSNVRGRRGSTSRRRRTSTL